MKAKHVVLTISAAALLLAFPLSAQAGVKYRVLHHFGSGSDAAGPSGPLLLDGKGDLYGATSGGGNGCRGGCGTVFKLTPRTNGTWGESIVYSFPGGDYQLPEGVLALDPSRNLYGTMLVGVFELSPGSGGWNFSALYNGPAGPGLLIHGLGNLYGQMGPGQDHGGAIGELSPGSGGWNYTQLYSFCSGNSCPDGVDMPTPPIWDGKGNMFGTTIAGGIYKPCWMYTAGCGVIYEMTPNGDGTWTYQVLHRFLEHSSKDGQTPNGGLVMDKAGNFYGTTELGGVHNNGIVFKLSHSSRAWRLQVLYDFPDCNVGCVPSGTLALDKGGNLYGTGSGGLANCGGYDCGVVFKLSPQERGRWNYRVLHKFTGKDGGFPGYGVILDGKGHLFGVTSQFGKYGFGTAFEITQ